MDHTRGPIMLETRRITDHWTMLPSFLPVPGLGTLAVNSFLLDDGEPLLVDTGLAALGDAWLRALQAEIDLADLRWIWLSHMDADHIGNLQAVLDRAPGARILTTFLGMGKLGLMGFDLSRVDLIEPGASFDKAGRSLMPVRPPYFDAPETVGFLDREDGVLFAADSFGALLADPVADLGLVGDNALGEGMRTWSAIDAPWLADVDRGKFGATLSALRRIGPDRLMSAHLPAVGNGIDRLLGIVEDAWCAGDAASDPLAIGQLPTWALVAKAGPSPRA